MPHQLKLAGKPEPNPIEMLFQSLMFQSRSGDFERCTVTITRADGTIMQQKASMLSDQREK